MVDYDYMLDCLYVYSTGICLYIHIFDASSLRFAQQNSKCKIFLAIDQIALLPNIYFVIRTHTPTHVAKNGTQYDDDDACGRRRAYIVHFYVLEDRLSGAAAPSSPRHTTVNTADFTKTSHPSVSYV